MTRRWITAIGAAFAMVALVVGVLIDASGSHQLVTPESITRTTPAEEYEWSDTAPSCDYSYLRPTVAQYLADVPRDARVLDLGCGNGAMVASFLDRGWDLVGVDISQSGLALARQRWPHIHFEYGDATGDLSRLGTFDAILSTEVIEHVFLPARFAQNAYRLLKPGGVLVLSTPYHGWLKNVVIAATNRADSHYQPLNEYGHIKFWSISTLSQLFWEAGFTDLEYTGVGRVPYVWKGIVMRARKPR